MKTISTFLALTCLSLLANGCAAAAPADDQLPTDDSTSAIGTKPRPTLYAIPEAATLYRSGDSASALEFSYANRLGVLELSSFKQGARAIVGFPRRGQNLGYFNIGSIKSTGANSGSFDLLYVWGKVAGTVNYTVVGDKLETRFGENVTTLQKTVNNLPPSTGCSVGAIYTEDQCTGGG